MHVPAQELRKKYLRHDKKFPHVWCPGCGNGIVMGSLLRAISNLKLSKDEVMMASGIGCSGRMPTYLAIPNISSYTPKGDYCSANSLVIKLPAAIRHPIAINANWNSPASPSIPSTSGVTPAPSRKPKGTV